METLMAYIYIRRQKEIRDIEIYIKSKYGENGQIIFRETITEEIFTDTILVIFPVVIKGFLIATFTIEEGSYVRFSYSWKR